VLVESSPLGIVIVQAGRALFANKTFERMTGREAAELLREGTDPLTVFDPESEHRIRKAVQDQDEGAQLEAQICQPSGKQIFVEVRTARLLFQDAMATMILASDVSAQRDLLEWLIRGVTLSALG